MILIGFWSLLGLLIGMSAAQRRGFSVFAGAVGGLLLGPLAFLMYFVNGVTRSDGKNRKCPHCAEWIKSEAKVCRYCGRDVDQISAYLSQPSMVAVVARPDTSRSVLTTILMTAVVLCTAALAIVIVLGWMRG